MSAVVQASMVTALMTARLRDAEEALRRKLDAANVQVKTGGVISGLARSRFQPTERRVLALLEAAREMVTAPDPVTVPPGGGLAPGPSKFAILGSAGFELPAYADMFSEAPAWRAATMRRGTPDPFLSLVRVPTATFVNATGAQALTDAAGVAGPIARANAFSMGLVASLAHATVSSPVHRSGHGRSTSKPWNRTKPADHHAHDDVAALRRLVGGSDPIATFRGWWPSSSDAAPLLASLHTALEATYHLEARDPGALGWPVYENAFVPGPALTPARVRSGYERLVSDLVPWSMKEWFGVLTPLLLGPGLSLILGGILLPGMRAFMTGATVTERSFSELITLADGINSITPFIYSMIMWANAPDQPREPFINALWTEVVRAGLILGWLPSIGSDTDDPHPGLRWGMAGGMLAVDGYAFIRFLRARGGRQPGPAVAFAVQNLPVILTAATIVQAATTKGVVAIAKEAGASDDTAAVLGWITAALTTIGLWLGAGLPIAKALSKGGGWLSWFASDELPSIRGSLTGGPTTATDTIEAAATFDDTTLWHDPAGAAPTLADLRYPTGGRPLVKVWRDSGSPELEIAHRGHLVQVRNGAAVTDVVIGPGPRTVGDVVTALTGVAGVLAAPAEAGIGYDLPWPATVAGNADEADPRPPAGDPAFSAFRPIPADADKPYVLRHAPDEDLVSRFGLRGPASSSFEGLRGVPRTGLGDVDDTVLGVAADLAVLLGLGAASRLRDVQPLQPRPDPALVPVPPPALAGPIGDVSQVFRDWNLDHRRSNEWRTIVAGGAAREAVPPADADLAEGSRVADAMGWVPLWRAWLRVASDTTQDTSSTLVSKDTPTAVAADGTTFRPTNAQLTFGVRYLLDLPV